LENAFSPVEWKTGNSEINRGKQFREIISSAKIDSLKSSNQPMVRVNVVKQIILRYY